MAGVAAAICTGAEPAAPGSTLAMTFLAPLAFVDPAEREMHQRTVNGARRSGTPVMSFFTPEEIVQLALASGFKDARHVSTEALTERYFAGRSDGLRPSTIEQLMVATT